jgi:hypothetical protein
MLGTLLDGAGPSNIHNKSVTHHASLERKFVDSRGNNRAETRKEKLSKHGLLVNFYLYELYALPAEV